MINCGILKTTVNKKGNPKKTSSNLFSKDFFNLFFDDFLYE